MDYYRDHFIGKIFLCGFSPIDPDNVLTEDSSFNISFRRILSTHNAVCECLMCNKRREDMEFVKHFIENLPTQKDHPCIRCRQPIDMVSFFSYTKTNFLKIHAEPKSFESYHDEKCVHCGKRVRYYHTIKPVFWKHYSNCTSENDFIEVRHVASRGTVNIVNGLYELTYQKIPKDKKYNCDCVFCDIFYSKFKQ